MFARGRNLGRRFSPQLQAVEQKPSATKLTPISSNIVPKNVKYDLRAHYRQVIEVATIGSLILFILAFRSSQEWRFAAAHVEERNIIIEVADIPPTEQIQRPPPPSRPAVPLPSESEEIPDDVTIESTELDLTELPPPPPPENPEEEASPFVAYDEPPKIIGGTQALFAALEYPKLAQQAGMEGIVIINVEVDEQGNTGGTRVVKGIEPKVGFEEAAIAALKKVKWKPAIQRDRPIRVWISVPVQFRLK